MDDYNFWADLLDTFQSSPDWIKALWIVAVPGFLLGVLALVLRFRLATMEATPSADRKLAYSIVCDENGFYRIYTHDTELSGISRTAQEPFVPLPIGAGPALAKHPPSEV